MCIKCLSMHLCCIFSARGRRGRRAMMRRRTGSSAEAESMRAGQRVQGVNGRPSAAKNGANPDISQQSFHNSSIFAGRSLTKLVSFRETFQDEIAN